MLQKNSTTPPMIPPMIPLMCACPMVFSGSGKMCGLAGGEDECVDLVRGSVLQVMTGGRASGPGGGFYLIDSFSALVPSNKSFVDGGRA